MKKCLLLIILISSFACGKAKDNDIPKKNFTIEGTVVFIMNSLINSAKASEENLDKYIQPEILNQCSAEKCGILINKNTNEVVQVINVNSDNTYKFEFESAPPSSIYKILIISKNLSFYREYILNNDEMNGKGIEVTPESTLISDTKFSSLKNNNSFDKDFLINLKNSLISLGLFLRNIALDFVNFSVGDSFDLNQDIQGQIYNEKYSIKILASGSNIIDYTGGGVDSFKSSNVLEFINRSNIVAKYHYDLINNFTDSHSAEYASIYSDIQNVDGTLQALYNNEAIAMQNEINAGRDPYADTNRVITFENQVNSNENLIRIKMLALKNLVLNSQDCGKVNQIANSIKILKNITNNVSLIASQINDLRIKSLKADINAALNRNSSFVCDSVCEDKQKALLYCGKTDHL